LTLITGRSTEQGTGISNGKELESYRTATSVLQLNPADMERLGIQAGDLVRVKTAFGAAVVTCQPDKLPEGMAFLAFGPASSELIGGETHASGMPDTKGFEIKLEPVAA
jgi:formylmethanofuran dehydrogenase subunit D